MPPHAAGSLRLPKTSATNGVSQAGQRGTTFATAHGAPRGLVREVDRAVTPVFRGLSPISILLSCLPLLLGYHTHIARFAPYIQSPKAIKSFEERFQRGRNRAMCVHHGKRAKPLPEKEI